MVVRRIADSSDPAVVSSLHRALDGRIGGTVELADEGPLSVEDFRIAGDARLIRARPGFRPIVRLDRSLQGAVREQSAVLVLKGKDLTLDGIDLIVDARELARAQTALFLCTGSNLTLRNCSITVLNSPGGTPLSLIRASGTGSRPTHIRLERCFFRGSIGECLRFTGGQCEAVIRDSVILAGGGPLLRLEGADATADNRIFVVQSLVAGPGPIIDWTKKSARGGPSKALVVRAFGSVFGRLYGVGIASVICSSDSSQAAGKQLDWSGEENLFAGWMGFFACGDDQTVTVKDLAAARSTWNGTELSSREILASWGHSGDLATTLPANFARYVESHRAVLNRAATPRAGLYEKAVGSYGDPAVPEPAEWTFVSPEEAPAFRSFKPGSLKPGSGVLPPEMTDMRSTGYRPTQGAVSGAAFELNFRTDAAPWQGDLGAFLRDRLSPEMTLVRVRVQGTGQHTFTPVRVPSGLRLEIKVEPFFQGELPTWSPQRGASGNALIELEGGALVLRNLNLRHEPTARLEHLIHVQDGHLVLMQCQLVSAAAPDFMGDLIAFRSVSSQPLPLYPEQPPFSVPIDRPVCRLVGSVLITGGRLLEAKLGRGLVAVSQCAIAAGGPAIELLPAKVARHRFEADLVLEQCTLTSERAIIRMGSWPGSALGLTARG